MQSRCFVLLGSAGLMLLSLAPSAGAVNLVPMDEPVTNLVPPPNVSPAPPAMHYDFSQNAPVVTMLTSTPLLCANTSTPLVPGVDLNIVYYSGFASGLFNPAPLPFVFGASSLNPSVSALATGAQGVGMTSSSMTFSGDALGSLVCYGLDASGTRRLTRDIFEDGADGVAYNSTTALSVFALPGDSAFYDYAYTVDVTVPPLPAGTNCSANGLDCNFVIMEGYDSSVFSTTNGGWCQAAAGSQSCSGPTSLGNIYFSIQAPIAPAAAKTQRFVVYRSFRSGITALPDTGAPVVIAALFSPNDLEENKLDDNVSTGNNQKANAAPSVTQDATFTSFAGSIAALSENTDSGTLTFNIGDSDTADGPGGSLHATVSLTVGGVSASVPADCSTSFGSGSGSNHACTIDLALNNANWWNGSVSSTYDGLFNTVATDATNGTYASGVSANLQITAIDGAGKAGAPVSVPVHIHSSVNNVPVITYGGLLATATDPNNNQQYPTYACSIGAGSAVGGCGTPLRDGFPILVDLPLSVTAVGGPAAAFDELASQTTAVVPYVDATDSGTNVKCDREQQAKVFDDSGGPFVSASQGSATQFGMNFLVPTTPPASAVSALCTLTITDVGPFPNGETAKTTSKQFRIVVNP